jgi:putative lipoprotein
VTRGRRLAAALPLAIALLAAPARAADPDPWFGHDKKLHFEISAALASGGYGATSLVTDDRRARLAVGGGFAFSVGVAKELWDLSGHGDASWRDLTWDAVGTVTGLTLAYAVDWLAQRTTSWLEGRPATAPPSAEP